MVTENVCVALRCGTVSCVALRDYYAAFIVNVKKLALRCVTGDDA